VAVGKGVGEPGVGVRVGSALDGGGVGEGSDGSIAGAVGKAGTWEHPASIQPTSSRPNRARVIAGSIIPDVLYHIWTSGCQMNVADSQRVASALERLGYQATPSAEQADVIVLNTCVVRQSAEDRAYGRLHSLRPLKQQRPEVIINLMGCLVGVKGNPQLQQAFPFIDVFSPPSDPVPLVEHLLQRDGKQLEARRTQQRFAAMDGEQRLPRHERGSLISAHVPVVYGCSHACTFCIIPFRRGAERSRPVGEVAAEVRSLAAQGVREVTLLGQIVDRYGKDIPDGPSLADLLRAVHRIEGIDRIRFLTSHPNWMSAELLRAVAELPKVCEHIEVPVQAGDDEVLHRMRRGYTADDYRRLIGRIRAELPGASIATDVIVGFPGETEQQFQRTFDLMAELRLDVAHLARYSPRPHTLAARQLPDDVPEEEKMRRFQALEDLQASIAADLHSALLGRTLEVLVERRHNGRWMGRTRTNKLVFFDSPDDWRGQLVEVRIDRAGPWSMSGDLASRAVSLPQAFAAQVH
jgi:tRNA-2-methylthio-N6-dimethylallyladenosine synthase